MASKKVLVIGDIIYDRYTYVSTERMSQEAPDVPVYDADDDGMVLLGGAGNVAVNIKALGGDEVNVFISGIFDEGFDDVDYILEDYGLLSFEPMLSKCFMEKHRFVEGGKHVFRVDNRKKFDWVDIHNFEFSMKKIDFNFDAIVFSDYDKGTITPAIVNKAIESEALIVVDSKRRDLSMYRGAHVLTFNHEEFGQQGTTDSYRTVEELFKHVIITKGAAGSELRWIEGQSCMIDKVIQGSYKISTMDFEAKKVDEVVDTTGCGDTHTAAITMGLLRDPTNIIDSVIYANQCAAIAVQRFGNARVSKWDLSKDCAGE